MSNQSLINLLASLLVLSQLRIHCLAQNERTTPVKNEQSTPVVVSQTLSELQPPKNQYGAQQARSQQQGLGQFDLFQQVSNMGFRQPPPSPTTASASASSTSQQAPSNGGFNLDFLFPAGNQGGEHSDFVKNMFPAGAPKGAQEEPDGSFDLDFRHMMPRSARPPQQTMNIGAMNIGQMIPQGGQKLLQDLMPGSGRMPVGNSKAQPQPAQGGLPNMNNLLKQLPGMTSLQQGAGGFQDNLRKMFARNQTQSGLVPNMDFFRQVPGMNQLHQGASGLRDNWQKMLTRGPNNTLPNMDFLRQVPGMSNLQQGATGFRDNLDKMFAGDPKGQSQIGLPNMDVLRQMPGMNQLQQGASGIQDNLSKMLGQQKGGHSWLNMGQWMNGESLSRMTEHVTLKSGEKISPMDYFLLDVVPTWFQARPANENGTFAQYKDIALSDESNDDAAHLSAVSTVR